MAKLTPFLGDMSDPNKAFPGIRELKVTVEQDPRGYYLKEHERKRASRETAVA